MALGLSANSLSNETLICCPVINCNNQEQKENLLACHHISLEEHKSSSYDGAASYVHLVDRSHRHTLFKGPQIRRTVIVD